MPITLSIIICTANKPESLVETLQSLSKVALPDGVVVELILVDNRPQTAKDVLCQATLPDIVTKYVEEPAAGLSNARNTGIANASGEILVFTDDDIRFPENWIVTLIEPILAGNADAVAGRIEIAPHLRCEWFQPLHKVLLAEFLQPWPNVNRMTGANMAIHRRVLEAAPNFDSNLGAGGIGAMEEGLFSDQIIAAGLKIAFNSKSTVIHHFDPVRLTKERMIKESAHSGRGQGYVAYHWEHRIIIGAPFHRYRKKLQIAARRLFDIKRKKTGEACSVADLYDVMAEAFYAQYSQERKKPFKYPRPGYKYDEIDSVKSLFRVLRKSFSKGSE